MFAEVLHFSGHPFTKKVVRIPGPSQIAMRLVSSISGVFNWRPSAAKLCSTANDADPTRNCFRLIFMASLPPHV